MIIIIIYSIDEKHNNDNNKNNMNFLLINQTSRRSDNTGKSCSRRIRALSSRMNSCNCLSPSTTYPEMFKHKKWYGSERRRWGTFNFYVICGHLKKPQTAAHSVFDWIDVVVVRNARHCDSLRNFGSVLVVQKAALLRSYLVGNETNISALASRLTTTMWEIMKYCRLCDIKQVEQCNIQMNLI